MGFAHWSRRDFLRTAGLTGLSTATSLSPWLARTAFGQTVPKKLVLMTSFNGTIQDSFFPSSEGSDFTLPPILEPLAAHKRDLLIVRGVDIKQNKRGPHDGHGPLLTNVQHRSGDRLGAGRSLDHDLGSRFASSSPIPVLNLGVQYRNWDTSYTDAVHYSDAFNPAPLENNPYDAFDRIFANEGQAPKKVPDQDRRRRVLDTVRGEVQRLENRVSTEDLAALRRHVQTIDRVEASLAAAAELSCGGPDLGDPINVNNRDNFRAVGRMQMDVMLAALSCGATRVGTIGWSGPTSGMSFRWLGDIGAHHALSHDGGATAELVEINKWYAEQFAYLVQKAKETPEPDGSSLFDNTVFLWMNPLSRRHKRESIPIVVAGGGWYFQLGRHVAFEGEPHGRFLVNVLHAMGFSGENTFGDSALSAGPLPGLT